MISRCWNHARGLLLQDAPFRGIYLLFIFSTLFPVRSFPGNPDITGKIRPIFPRLGPENLQNRSTDTCLFWDAGPVCRRRREHGAMALLGTSSPDDQLSLELKREMLGYVGTCRNVSTDDVLGTRFSGGRWSSAHISNFPGAPSATGEIRPIFLHLGSKNLQNRSATTYLSWCAGPVCCGYREMAPVETSSPGECWSDVIEPHHFNLPPATNPGPCHVSCDGRAPGSDYGLGCIFCPWVKIIGPGDLSVHACTPVGPGAGEGVLCRPPPPDGRLADPCEDLTPEFWGDYVLCGRLTGNLTTTPSTHTSDVERHHRRRSAIPGSRA